jgi:dolichyl-diphosphooligosaccharide--protein glycosyltransferase
LLYESKSNNSIFLGQDYKTTKQVKVFEYVKGAKITGWAAPGAEITISTNVATNQGEEFTYQNSMETEDGKFEFVVPYSTGTQEKSEVSADIYKIKTGSYVKEIKVTEDDIINGKTVTAN